MDFRLDGAHINPVVTLAFRLMGKLDLSTTLGYVGAQLTGAVVGSLARQTDQLPSASSLNALGVVAKGYY